MVKYSKVSFLVLSQKTFVYVRIPQRVEGGKTNFQFKEIRLAEATGKNILFLGSIQ